MKKRILVGIIVFKLIGNNAVHECQFMSAMNCGMYFSGCDNASKQFACVTNVEIVSGEIKMKTLEEGASGRRQ